MSSDIRTFLSRSTPNPSPSRGLAVTVIHDGTSVTTETMLGDPPQPDTSSSVSSEQQSDMVSKPSVQDQLVRNQASLTTPEPEDLLKPDCTMQCCELTTVIPVRLQVDRSLTHHISQNGKRKRCFNNEWLLTFTWLVIYKTTGQAFCQTCRYSVKNKLDT